jgi:hypothetical protein
MEPKAKQSPESAVREIKRRTRRKFNSEEKSKRDFFGGGERKVSYHQGEN